MTENNENILVFTDDEGAEVKFEHLDTIELADKGYIVCVPMQSMDEDFDEVEEVVIFEAIKDENGEDCFALASDEDTLEKIYEIFKGRNADMFDFED